MYRVNSILTCPKVVNHGYILQMPKKYKHTKRGKTLNFTVEQLEECVREVQTEKL